jgi:hypothetical protein
MVRELINDIYYKNGANKIKPQTFDIDGLFILHNREWYAGNGD